MLKECLLAEIPNRDNRFLWWAVTKELFTAGSSRKSVLEYRLACWLSRKGFRRVSTMYFHRLESRYALYIGKKTVIGPGLKLPHPVGVVIGEGVKIGRDCTIYQQTTIGGKDIGDAQSNVYPIVGDNVVIFAGARIIGAVRVHSGSMIGANSVVLSDVEEKSIVVGAPARKIGTRD